MANTTFTGPVISNNGFQQGSVTTLPDSDLTLTKNAHAGRIILVTNVGAERDYTLPAPEEGVAYRFVYNGDGGTVSDGNIIFQTPGNTNFYLGCLTFLDTNGTQGNEISIVFPDEDSNSKLTLTTPGPFDITIMGKDSTNYQVFGTVTAATAPAFADQ